MVKNRIYSHNFIGEPQKLYFNHFTKLIRLATKMSTYNSFMPQRFCNTVEYVNSKQITKEYVFNKLSHSKHKKICSDMN